MLIKPEVDGNLETVENPDTKLNNGNPLTDKKVKVVPVVRGGGWLQGEHDGAFMYTGCIFQTDLPIDSKRGQLVSILSKEEQAFFEKELFLKDGDLSIYKKDNNFWHTFKVKLDKEETTLDLNDPLDNLKWRVLMVDPRVAPSWEQRFDLGSYKFVLVDEELETQKKVKKANTRKDAYMYLGKIENNASRMRDVLRVYGNDPGPNAKPESMYVMLDTIIEDDVTLPKFMEVIGDPHMEMKIFIEDAAKCGALEKNETRYYLPGGDKIANTLVEAIDYFKDALNQDVYLRIKNQINLSGE